jgi:hypothetical protein
MIMQGRKVSTKVKVGSMWMLALNSKFLPSDEQNRTMSKFLARARDRTHHHIHVIPHDRVQSCIDNNKTYQQKQQQIMPSDNYKAYVAIPMHIFSSEEAAAAPSASFRRERVRALCSRDGYLVPKIIAAILVAILIVILLPLWMRRASS